MSQLTRPQDRRETNEERGTKKQEIHQLIVKSTPGVGCGFFCLSMPLFFCTPSPLFFRFWLFLLRPRSTPYPVCRPFFFFLPATPAGIALFSPPFFRVANVDAIFPPAFFPPPSPPRSPCKSNRSWCVSFFFLFPLLSFFFCFLSSFPSFYPLQIGRASVRERV